MHSQPPPPLYDDGTTMTTSSTQLNHDNHNTNNNKTTTTSPTIMNQHWLNSSTPKTISSYQLQHMLHTDPLNVLILDCRSHQSHFNKSHILTALHCGSLHNNSNNSNNNNNNNKMKNDHDHGIDEKNNHGRNNAKQLENEFLSFQDRIFFRQREFVDTIVLYTSVSPPSLLNNNNNNKNDDMSNHAIGECLDKKSHSKMNNNNNTNDIDIEANEVEWQCMMLLVNAMKEEQLNEKIYILEHGFTHFQSHCPLYCEYNYNDKRAMMDSVSSDDTASHHHHSDAVTSDDDNDEKTNKTNDENGNSHHHQMKSVVHCMSKKQRLQLCHKRLFGSFTHKMSCESPSKLLPFLYLGSAQNSFNLDQMKQLNISCIVNMALEVENFYPELFHYIKCDLLDDETADVSIHFEETFQFIERARKNRQRILIACFMGMSRSASVSIAYIMRAKRWTMKKSYMFVKKQRPIININSAFMYQLMSYEVSLFGESSFPIIFKSSACHSLCHHTNLNKGIDDDEKEINISKSESNDSKVLKDNQPTTPLPSKSIQVSDSMNILLS